MHIFIDESGLFKPTNDAKQWSSIGAFVVPDTALEHLPNLLNLVKKSHGLTEEEEFKRPRPDENSESFLNLFEELKKLNCSFHALVFTGSPGTVEAFEEYKKNIHLAVNNYAKRVALDARSLEFAISLIDKLSDQQLNQCMLQCYMIDELLRKIIPFYAMKSPKSLGKFVWKVDAKELKETNYDKAFDMLYCGIVGLNKPLPIILNDKYDYRYLFDSYEATPVDIGNHIKETKINLGVDLSLHQDSLLAFDKSKLLRDNFSLVDSKQSIGLQISDLITSSLNRCLKLNFDDNAAIARSIGSLVINSPTIHPAINIFPSGMKNHGINEGTKKALELINHESIKIFNDRFQQNYSKQI